MRVLALCFVFSLIAGIEAGAQPLPAQQPVPYGSYAGPVPAPAPQAPFARHHEGASAGSYLGVGLLEINRARADEIGLNEPSGVEVTNVDPESPADEAGIQRGDVILQFRGQKVLGREHFIRLVRETPVGRNVALTVWRKGSEVNLHAEIGQREPSQTAKLWFCGEEDGDCEVHIPQFTLPSFDFDFPRPNFVLKNRGLGVELEELGGQLAQYFGVEQGVLVRSVDANSPAEKAGLQAGDVLISIAGKAIEDVKDVRSAIHSADGAEIPIELLRNKSKRTVKIEAREEDRPRGGRRGFRRNISAPRDRVL